MVSIVRGGRHRRGHVERFIANQPVISQITERISERKDDKADEVRKWVKATLTAFGSMRYLDFNLDAMRLPSLSGQTTLGDRGENLHRCCRPSTKTKNVVPQWSNGCAS